MWPIWAQAACPLCLLAHGVLPLMLEQLLPAEVILSSIILELLDLRKQELCYRLHGCWSWAWLIGLTKKRPPSTAIEHRTTVPVKWRRTKNQRGVPDGATVDLTEQ